MSELLKCTNIPALKLVPLDTEPQPSPSGSLALLKIISGVYSALFTKSSTEMEAAIRHSTRRENRTEFRRTKKGVDIKVLGSR